MVVLADPVTVSDVPARRQAGLTQQNQKSTLVSIEQGYFIFTLMPSLFCKLRCPHCYLSLEQRKDRTIMSVADLRHTCIKVDRYYTRQQIGEKTVVCYWYGGEPTSMGQAYFTDAADTINGVFSPAGGYRTKHTVLTALVGVKDDWFQLFDRYGEGEVQSSYDGEMRGKAYMKRWDERARAVTASGLRLSTISVVNRALLDQGPAATLDYLAEIGVAETSWLPFMWNEQNDSGAYGAFAPSMAEYCDFMIGLSEYWLKRREAGDAVPEIGQLRFILQQSESPLLANIAGQTLFLLPNGDFVLPDYHKGWQEFMRPFGNILEQEFEEILTSSARRRYLRRQVLRNGNQECLDCDHADKCIMEFWKDNRPNDVCFGARDFVEWALSQKSRIRNVVGDISSVLY
jgi:sulfatase maturation enzyme AslB (radical SAM superfamily)